MTGQQCGLQQVLMQLLPFISEYMLWMFVKVEREIHMVLFKIHDIQYQCRIYIIDKHPLPLSAKKCLVLSEETDLEASTEESIDCMLSDLDKSKTEEVCGKEAKVQYICFSSAPTCQRLHVPRATMKHDHRKTKVIQHLSDEIF